jgi:glycine/D-amino acid oxidase-like deaminating enzyme
MSFDRQYTEAISLWDYSAPELPEFSPLEGDVQTDVAIVGGGFTGNSTALHLAEKGVDCRVLEGESIGFGGSGRNVGLVNAGLWLPPQDVRKLLGDAHGNRLVDILGRAPGYVFSLIEKHQIQCEATQQGTIHAAHSPKGFADLARRAEEWNRIGAPVDLLGRAEAAEKIGSPSFFGGLLDHRAGTINPMGYVRGLARTASNAGARIHTATRVNRLQQDGSSWKLETSGGAVTAKHVVLGTNAYTDGLWPGLQQTFTIIHYFQVATEPLGDRTADILPEGQGVWDTGTVMFSIRKDAAGRLLFGSMGKLIGGESGLSKHWAKRTLERLFPNLGEVGWQKAWHGKIAMTNDHLPRIHRLAPNVYTPIGYNGRGITPGTMFGKAMAELLTGLPEEELPLPISDLRRDPASGWKSALYEGAFKAYRVYKSL